MADGALGTTNVLLGTLVLISVLEAIALATVVVVAIRLCGRMLRTLREVEQRLRPLADRANDLAACDREHHNGRENYDRTGSVGCGEGRCGVPGRGWCCEDRARHRTRVRRVASAPLAGHRAGAPGGLPEPRWRPGTERAVTFLEGSPFEGRSPKSSGNPRSFTCG